MTQVLGLMAVVVAAGLGQPLVSGLKNPESAAVGPDGRVYVSEIGDFDRPGDGRVLVLDKGQALPFATGLDDPKGMVWWQGWLFVADGKQVWRIDRKGKAEVFAAAEAFPTPPRFLNDLAVDEQGALYVSDSGDLKGQGGAVYRIDPKGKVRLISDASRAASLQVPNGLVMDGLSHLLVADFGSGELLRVRVADGSAVKVAAGLGGGDGLAWDRHGRLFISDGKAGRLLVIPRPGDDPVPLPVRFQSAADLCLDASTKNLLVPDMKAGTVTAVPAVVPGQGVEDAPLALTTTLAFPDLEWTGWTGKNDKGKVENFRPIVLTHAGDGSNRVFLATQHGVIHVFPNDQKATKTQVFLDLQERVSYDDNRNEEGFLGLAFHPRFQSNGEFFVFYTTKKAKLTNIVARFRVRKDDPTRADPDSEEILLQIAKPYWNHDGGTICFGPDGFLYITHGDGGSANDPHHNGQNLKTLLGKVLRIDVDRKDPGKNYAVPRDNPFRDRADALPEIWAYGLRNIWRMAFDRKTGRLWAGDVGQNLYEEINLIERGGNYGWNLREGLHPFGAKGVGPRPDLIEPIWEYHHDTGKSITGGLVYRGQRFPELQGAYLYGDYVTGHIWALRYDSDRKRVIANQRIPSRNNVPILSFGEDEQGEVYYMTYNPFGKGIYRFERMEPKLAR